MGENCTKCHNLYASTTVVEYKNTQKTTFCWICLKDRDEFKKLVETKDDTEFFCPEFEQR